MVAWLVASVAMEVEQVFHMDKTGCIWGSVWKVCETHSLGKEIVCLIGQCVLWLIILYSFYHCNLYFHGRQRKARQNKLLEAYRIQSLSEQAAVDQYWPGSDVHHVVESTSEVKIPRRRRSSANRNAKKMPVAEEIPRLVPVIMCTPECSRMQCQLRLYKWGSELRAPCQEIKCLEASGLLVQTQMLLNLLAKPANKLRGIVATAFCSVLTVQLGRWRACCLVDGKVTTVKLEETDRVPVILHSSYAAGLLTIEGINLSDATIQTTKASRGDCRTLETEFNEGAGGLEICTCMLELDEIKNFVEMSVIAFREIEKDGHELRVSSLLVQIQDDSLRTVIRDIVPYTILVVYAFTKILLSGIYATSIVAWLIPFVIIASTQILPQSTEATIKLLLMKSIYHMFCSFYCAIQSFRDAYFCSIENRKGAEFSRRKDSETKRQQSRKQASHLIPEVGHSGESDESDESDDDESFDESSDDNTFKRMKVRIEVEDFVAAHDSGSVLSSNWQWPIYDTIHENKKSFLKLREKTKDVLLDEKTQMVPFLVVYLHLKDLPWAKQVKVHIYSSILKALFLGKNDLRGVKKIVSIDGPELFRGYEILKERLKTCEAEQEEPSTGADARTDNEESQHITHLLRFMDKELEEIRQMYEDMKNERIVTWDMLWAFFPPGEKVIYRDNFTDENVRADVLWTDYQESQEGLKLVMKVTKWDYNCKSWSQYTSTLSVSAYEGGCAITSLNVYPLQFEEDPKASEEAFLDAGKRFCELSMMQRNCYMNYKGSMVSYIFVDTCYRVKRENADGRIMIDLGSFSKMNPDYPMGSAKPPCEIIRDNIVVNIAITEDPNRKFAPSFVYGFSFRLKEWGCFSVCGISEIKFNDLAYDDLVMPAETKALTECLVKEHLKGSKNKVADVNKGADGADVIANKGEGCIFLCYGPPGTGKTLTAESLSEKLHCPLWCLSIFELGTTPAALETMLVKVLDVVASWGAILLLDEADVYLERRSTADLARNAMTGVFLRQLEYYRGVLFLTTNRDSEFDEAICSRISMFLYYGRHDEHQRSEIWTSMFRRVGLNDVTPDTLAEFSKPDFNGREIRKIMKIAQTLANSKGEKLQAQHVTEALTAYEASSKLRMSLIPSARAGLHRYRDRSPLELQEECSNSAFAPKTCELHPSSGVTNKVRVQKCLPQLTPCSSSNQASTTVECLPPNIVDQKDSM